MLTQNSIFGDGSRAAPNEPAVNISTPKPMGTGAEPGDYPIAPIARRGLDDAVPDSL